jgi:hypothetical protein
VKLQVDVNVSDLVEAEDLLDEIRDALGDGELSGVIGDGGRFELLVPVEPLAH